MSGNFSFISDFKLTQTNMSVRKEITQPSTSKSSPMIQDVQCKKCFKNLKNNSILKHLSQSRKQNCMSEYTEEEINGLKKDSKKLTEQKKNLWKQKNKDHEANYAAERYKAKQKEINEKHKKEEMEKFNNDLSKYKRIVKNMQGESILTRKTFTKGSLKKRLKN